jgi:hypothetical protein
MAKGKMTKGKMGKGEMAKIGGEMGKGEMGINRKVYGTVIACFNFPQRNQVSRI